MDGLTTYRAGARSTVHIFSTAEGAFRRNMYLTFLAVVLHN